MCAAILERLHEALRSRTLRRKLLTLTILHAISGAKHTRLTPRPQLHTTYRGPTTPLTSLALSPSNTILYSGSWDKSIWSWSLSSRKPLLRYHGHTDFVKSVLCALISAAGAGSQPLKILISGSGDATIIVWDVLSGDKLATVRETGRILDLAIDPASFTFPNPLTPTENGKGMRIGKRAINAPNAFTLYAASSDPEIRRYILSADETGIKFTKPDISRALTHETSVNALHFHPALPSFPAQASDLPDWLDEEGSRLFTASSDKTARSFTSEPSDNITTPVVWTADLQLQHPDFVRAIIFDTASNMVVTACRDEEVRVYDADTGKLVHIWRGHFEEVTALALIRSGDGRGNDVVSVSIDGTVRCWSLDVGVMGKAREREEVNGEVVGEAKEERGKGVELTKEEEDELADLMGDSDG